MVMELLPGDPRKVGPYWLLGRLGSGGMGRVFLARSPGGRHVAVKVVRAELAEQADFRARFAREVAAAQTVSGLFTAPVVDADLDGPVPWLATAYVAGPSLADAVTGHGPLPVTSVLALAAGLAEGLGAIHAAGIVHRDLKPSNVLLADDGPRIIDFGISRAAEPSMLTGTGLVVGSPGFMSPEQAEGRDIGPPSDVFSLGAVLAFAATGEGPFGTGSTATLAYRVVHTPPAIDDLPGGLRPLVERCLAKDPEQRPTTDQLLTGLDAHPAAGWLPVPIAQAFPLHAPPDPAPEGAAAADGPPGPAGDRARRRAQAATATRCPRGSLDGYRSVGPDSGCGRRAKKQDRYQAENQALLRGCNHCRRSRNRRHRYIGQPVPLGLQSCPRAHEDRCAYQRDHAPPQAEAHADADADRDGSAIAASATSASTGSAAVRAIATADSTPGNQ